jgi:hypothetical protein
MKLNTLWDNAQKHAFQSTVDEFKQLLLEAKPRLSAGLLRNMSMACGHFNVVRQAAKEADMEYVL